MPILYTSDFFKFFWHFLKFHEFFEIQHGLHPFWFGHERVSKLQCYLCLLDFVLLKEKQWCRHWCTKSILCFNHLHLESYIGITYKL